MGDECKCTVRLEGKTFEGRAHLDLEKLLFRSKEKKLTIPLAAVKSTTVKNGVLEIDCPEGLAVFELGALAQKWAQKILRPKSLIDKLGVKPDSRVCIINVIDDKFWQQIRQRVSDITEGPRHADYDLIFFGAEKESELKALASLRKRLKKTGAIWVVRPKGKNLSDVAVIAAAKSVGLVDVKVASFSASHSAEKLMIPRSAR